MPEKPPQRTYLSLAFGAVLAVLEARDPGLIDRAYRLLKNEPDISLVWGLHGEHQSDDEREAHAQATEFLRRARRVVARKRRITRPKLLRRKKA